jgi:hypothetical protein
MTPAQFQKSFWILVAFLLATFLAGNAFAQAKGPKEWEAIDVPLGDPDFAVRPGMKYVQGQSESMLLPRQAVVKIAKETIPQ